MGIFTTVPLSSKVRIHPAIPHMIDEVRRFNRQNDSDDTDVAQPGQEAVKHRPMDLWWDFVCLNTAEAPTQFIWRIDPSGTSIYMPTERGYQHQIEDMAISWGPDSRYYFWNGDTLQRVPNVALAQKIARDLKPERYWDTVA